MTISTALRDVYYDDAVKFNPCVNKTLRMALSALLLLAYSSRAVSLQLL